MTYTLKLGDTASLVFQNAINESQALAQLRSAFPQMTQGLVEKKGWREVLEKDWPGGCIGDEVDCGNGKWFVRDESKDLYHEPQIKLVENK
jgi:hypothetical protein